MLAGVHDGGKPSSLTEQFCIDSGWGGGVGLPWVNGLGAEAAGKVSKPVVHVICIHPLRVWMVESEAHIGCGKGRICIDKCMPLKSVPGPVTTSNTAIFQNLEGNFMIENAKSSTGQSDFGSSTLMFCSCLQINVPLQ